MSAREPEWREIPGFPLYEVSDQGQIRSWKNYGAVTPHLLKMPLNHHGYPTVSLYGDHGVKTRPVHRFVLLAFRGPKPPGMVGRHANGIRTDNRLSNLNYSTVTQNNRDQLRHRTHAQASKTHCSVGHPFNASNTYLRTLPNGAINRVCLECRRQRGRSLHHAGRALRAIAELLAAETRPVIEVERIRELIPGELLSGPTSDRTGPR